MLSNISVIGLRSAFGMQTIKNVTIAMRCGSLMQRNNLSSDASTTTEKSTQSTNIKKTVLISQSNDIYTNLALEDWIYRKYDFSNKHVLLLWVNDPCVVIGRHQNPFSETNVAKLQRDGIALARRNSGGGAVYHDRQNLNCTFFTARDRYNRSYNLNIITRALYREYGINAEISVRDDITLFGKKISGTAAKLGRPNAYHHCTLLVDSNKEHLSGSLVKDGSEIVSNATASVRSPIKNLRDVNQYVRIGHLGTAIGHEYLRTDAINLDIECREMIQQQNGFQYINPTEEWFPGLNEIRDELSSWNWCIGKSPKFSVHRNMGPKPNNTNAEQSSSSETTMTTAVDDGAQLKLKVDVVEGLIDNVTITRPGSNSDISVVTELKGQPYDEDKLNAIVQSLKDVSTDNVRQAINGF